MESPIKKRGPIRTETSNFCSGVGGPRELTQSTAYVCVWFVFNCTRLMDGIQASFRRLIRLNNWDSKIAGKRKNGSFLNPAEDAPFEQLSRNKYVQNQVSFL